MIDKDIDKLAEKVGGKFRLCSMVIRRARAMVMAYDSSGSERLNSQIIRQVLTEIDDGHLLLRPVKGEAESTPEAVN